MSKKVLKLFCLLPLVLFFVACVTRPVETESPSGAVMSAEEHIQIQSDARYIFEQMILPQALLANEMEMLGVVWLMHTANVEGMRGHLLLLWEFATTNVIWRELIEQQGEVLPASEEEIFMRASKLRPSYGLGDEHIVDVSLVEIDEETNAFIIKLLDINTALRSTYVGIAYNETMGLRIFTLEGVQDASGSGVGAHMFCFIEIGSRGSFHIIENDRQVFIDSIRDAMNGLIEPSAGRERPVS